MHAWEILVSVAIFLDCSRLHKLSLNRWYALAIFWSVFSILILRLLFSLKRWHCNSKMTWFGFKSTWDLSLATPFYSSLRLNSYKLQALIGKENNFLSLELMNLIWATSMLFTVQCNINAVITSDQWKLNTTSDLQERIEIPEWRSQWKLFLIYKILKNNQKDDFASKF